MNTKEAIERLPWLVNGSLEPVEAAEVRQQLAESEECRKEFVELAQAAELFGSRIPAEVLLDYVSGRDVAPFESDVIERFLDASPGSREEWRMASESWNGLETAAAPMQAQPESSGDVLPFRRRAEAGERSARTWRAAAIAASLVAVLGVAGWWSEFTGDGSVGHNPTIIAVEAVESDLVLRDTPAGTKLIERSSLGPVQLSLVSETEGARQVEILDSDGKVAWAPAQEFVPDRYGDIIVAIPQDLEAGIYSVQLYRVIAGERQAAELYSIELR